MNKAVFWKISIISIILLFVSGFAMCPHATAQWGGGFGNSGRWGFGSSFGQGGYFGNGYFGPSYPSTSSSTKSWAGWNNNSWEEFITALQEEYPDLEGVDWSTWEEWDDANWEALRTALENVRTEESLASFISDVTAKWAEYDSTDWATFSTNWNNFIAAAAADTEDDTELTWTGFVSAYGCSDIMACFQAYATWANAQWSDFRGIYSKYLDYEWVAFNEVLQTKLEDYYTVDLENWREWTDADWESYLNKYSSFSTRSSNGYGYGAPSSGFNFINPSGFGYNNAGGFGFGASGGYYGYGQGGYGYGAPSGGYYNGGYGGQGGYGYGAPSGGYYNGGYGGQGGYGYGAPSGGYYNGGYGGQGGYGYGAPSGGYYNGGYGGSPSWGGGWW